MGAVDSYKGISNWRDAWALIKRQLPDVVTKRKVNFIFLHYTFIIGVSILLSVIIFGIGNLAYIDALFFATGACTQSGLNTIDVNLLRTGQQVCFYIGAMLCNPIVIHSSVVFFRLYSFEKRFKDLVKDAQALRRTKSKGRFGTNDDVEGQHEGLAGKAIRHLKNTTWRVTSRNNSTADAKETIMLEKPRENESSDDTPRDSESPERPPPRRPSAADSIDLRLPSAINSEQHISFVENQRNPKDNTTLRIPGPREFDRGDRPQDVSTEGDDRLSRTSTERRAAVELRKTVSSPQMATVLTFKEPDNLPHRNRKDNFPRTNSRRSNVSRPDPPARKARTFNLGSRSFTINSLRRTPTNYGPMPYLTYEPTVGRNSFFVGLSEEEREELGGIEYRSLKTLALILIGYFFGFHLFGILCLVPWIMRDDTYGRIPTNVGQGRVWWGFFTAQSAFNDLGFTLTPDSMISFQRATFPILIMTFLIIIGNTGFPCMLRFVIWVLSKVVRPGSAIWEELQFLLDHPRRCFTLLFPRAATWWLFAILVFLNGLDLFFFVVLDLDEETVSALPGWYKFTSGLFQAASTRTAGFAVVNIANLHPAIQVSYLIMMYISVFPIAISVRRTNVYEEKSLGIYSTYEEQDNEKEPSYVGAHLRKQLSFDLWFIFLGLFIISIVEGARLQNTNEYAFTIFSVLFEIVSAYGTVGLSLGYPTINASFSAEFKVLSKLVIIAMQVRGRHRGLPYGLDRAVLLPSEKLHETEKVEAQRMATRRSSIAYSVRSSAVDGHLESTRFRPETGLLSSNDAAGPSTPRARRFTDRSHHTFNSIEDVVNNDKQHATGNSHRGLGTAMHRNAVASDTIEE